MRFETRELEQDDVGAAAGFLAETLAGGPESAARFESWLRWAMEKTARGPAGTPRGWILVSEREEVLGFHLATPYEYRIGGETHWGLVSSNLYVDERAHGMPAFALFKKYLVAMPELAHWCSTANEISSKLWEAVGAQRVDGSDQEHIRLNRLSPDMWRYAWGKLLEKVRWPAGGSGPRRQEGSAESRTLATARLESVPSLKVLEREAHGEVNWPEREGGIVPTRDLVEWLGACPTRDIFLAEYGDWHVILESSRRGTGRGFRALSILDAWGRDGGVGGSEEMMTDFIGQVTRKFGLCRLASDYEASLPAHAASLERRQLSRYTRWVVPAGSNPEVMTSPWNGLDEI